MKRAGSSSKFIEIHNFDYDCHELIGLLEDWPNQEGFPTQWDRGRTGTASISEHRTSDVLGASSLTNNVAYANHPLTRATLDLMGKLDEFIHVYKAKHKIPLTQDNGWMINRYKPGQEYQPHFDYSPNEPRSLSLVAMMNDVEEGGELYFPYQDVKVPASAGVVVLFPSAFPYQHASLPVVAGVKYSMVTWLQ